MPSNKQHIEDAEALAEELGIEIETDGMNNADLAALVSDLKAKKKDAETDTQADAASENAEAKAAAEAEAKAAAEAEAKKPPYSVAGGKSITSKRGILSDGDEIKASDLSGGEEALAAFVRSGHVVKA